MPSLGHVVRLALVAALGAPIWLVGFVGFGSPAAAAGCSVPTLVATVDPASSRPYAPLVHLSARNLALPATGRFGWGDGRFSLAGIGASDGALDPEPTIQPDYRAPGTYSLALTVTDACGTSTTLSYPVTVPLRLPARVALTCPGTADASGYCVVPLGMESSVSVRGGEAGVTWRWTAPPGSGTADGDRYRLRPGEGRLIRLQASARTASGWLVTPPLDIVAIAAARPRITAFGRPGTVQADRPLSVGFTIPDGSADGRPSIYVDDRKVSDAAAATITLAPGSHTLTYRLSYPDGGVVQRQTIVVATSGVAAAGLVGGGAILSVALAGGAGLLLRRRRSRVATGSAKSGSAVVESEEEATRGEPRDLLARPELAATGRPTAAARATTRDGRLPRQPAARSAPWWLVPTGLAIAIAVGAAARQRTDRR